MAISISLSDINGTYGFVFNGVNGHDSLGVSVSSAGDFNSDGFDDLIIGAPGGDPNGTDLAGESYVIFGTAIGFPSDLELSSLNGTNGFVINGIDAGDYSGSVVSNAGDVNDDGFDDLIIGADGKCYVIFGKPSGFGATLELSSLNGINGFVINGVDPGDYFSHSVSAAGDINGDGFDDLIIGAPRATPDGNFQAGESYVIFGKASGFGATLELSSLNGTNGFVINGVDPGDFSSSSVSAAGDINGDGFQDLIIGAPGGNPNGTYLAGESYVVFGKLSGFSASFDLSSLDGSNGFVIKGFREFDKSGFSVSGAGDINGDGFDDLIIGSKYGGYVVFGKESGFSASIDLSSLDGRNGFVISELYTWLGISVSGAGDVNGDGYDDLIIGDPDLSIGNHYRAGVTYLVFGKADGFSANLATTLLDSSNGIALTGEFGDAKSGLSDLSGSSVSDAGDINNDGFDDIIIGAPGAGKSYVFFGASFVTDDQLIIGTDGNDSLIGFIGNDTLVGSNGNDFIVGGYGTDTAVINDLRRAVTITTVSDDHTVQSADGTDAIDASTEIIRFLDGNLYFGADNAAAEVNRLYLTTLDRGPDAGGLAYWTDAIEAGTSLLDLANTFLASPEWQAKYGALNNGAFVLALYNNVLDRDPDLGGYNYWKGLLDGGSLSRPQLVLNFSESSEFKQNTAGDIAGGLWTVDDDAAFVLRAYKAGLDREPDRGGLAYWIETLHDGTASRQDVANAFAAAPEFVQTYGTLTNQQFVEQMYLNALDRPGDTNGIAYWTTYLDGGAARGVMVTLFAESQELIANTQPLVDDGLYFV